MDHLNLESKGYKQVEEFRGLKAGTRVRLSSQQYSDAILRGTAVVERVYVNPNSAWEQKYGIEDVEVVLRWDRERWGDTHALAASYNLVIVPVIGR